MGFHQPNTTPQLLRKHLNSNVGLRRVNIKFIVPIISSRMKQSKFLQTLDEETRKRVVEFSMNPKCEDEEFERLFYLYCQWYDEMFWYYVEESLEDIAIEYKPELERLAYRETCEYNL